MPSTLVVVLKRLLAALPNLVGVIILTFLLTRASTSRCPSSSCCTSAPCCAATSASR
jgi:ABC-type dipeptide/oligopeptide/nickel transport system permease component